MRYFIAHVIKGPVAEYHQMLVYDVATRFDLKVRKGYFPSHITFKSPFEIKNITFLKKELEKYAQSHHAAPFRIEGFGHFGTDVIFLDVKLPLETLRAVNGLRDAFYKQPKIISWEEYEARKHFHITVTKKFPAEKFSAIWTYLKDKALPQFELLFDSIALLHLENEKWVIDSEYQLLP